MPGSEEDAGEDDDDGVDDGFSDLTELRLCAAMLGWKLEACRWSSRELQVLEVVLPCAESVLRAAVYRRRDLQLLLQRVVVAMVCTVMGFARG